MLEVIVLRVGMVSLTCSAVLLPLLLLARRLRSRYAARTCYFLWLLLALRLALPFRITLPTPVVTVEAPSYTITIPGDRDTDPQTAPNASPMPPLAGVPESPAAFPMTPKVPAEPPRTVSLMEILGAVWLAGVAVYGVYFLLTYAAARRRLLSRAEPAGENETAWLRSIAGKADCHRAARLYRSEDVRSPMMLGLLRPTILLPAYPVDEEELTIVLWHELTHLKRGDVAYKLLLLVANGVHWFNPLVWWMTREASRNVELCCDDDVVRRRGREFRRLYGEVLLRTARELGPTPALSTRFGGGKAQMKERLANLFRRKRHSAALVCCVFLAALLTGALVACESESGTFTLSGEEPVKSEQIQPRSSTVRVSGDRDTDVVFTDVETGEEYKIGYLTPGASEKIQLQKGKWYTVAGGGKLTVSPVNVRVVDFADDPMSGKKALDLLEESIAYDEGILSFTIPDADTPPWHVIAAGRLEYPDGFSSSIHYFTDTEWTRGETYYEQVGESAPFFTELFLDVTLSGYQRSIDLLPYVQPKDHFYIDHERGFLLQFPEEWAGLVEIENASEDGSVLVLYHVSGRSGDDPTAGVLATLCATTAADFNALYGDKDLIGMYKSGGPRIWVLGTAGEYLVYSHVDVPPNGYAGQSEEFARLHQQLAQSPCVTFIPLRQDDASDNVEVVGGAFDGTANDYDGVTMTIVDGTVSPGGATVEILNTTEEEITSGNNRDVGLQMERNGLWYWLETTGEFFNTLEAYVYEKDDPRELALTWVDKYGHLTPGHYRIAKWFDGHSESGNRPKFLLVSEFTLE